MKCGKIGILNVNIRNLDGFECGKHITLFESSIKPLKVPVDNRMHENSVFGAIDITVDGLVRLYVYGSTSLNGWVRAVIPFIAAE